MSAQREPRPPPAGRGHARASPARSSGRAGQPGPAGRRGCRRRGLARRRHGRRLGLSRSALESLLDRQPGARRAGDGRAPAGAEAARVRDPRSLVGFAADVLIVAAGAARGSQEYTGAHADARGAVLGVLFGARLGVVAALAPLVARSALLILRASRSATRLRPRLRAAGGRLLFVAVLVGSAAGVAGRSARPLLPPRLTQRRMPHAARAAPIAMFEIGQHSARPVNARLVLRPGGGGDQDPHPLHPRPRGGGFRRAARHHLQQGLPARLRRLPGPGRAAVRRRVQLAPSRPPRRGGDSRSTRPRRGARQHRATAARQPGRDRAGRDRGDRLLVVHRGLVERAGRQRADPAAVEPVHGATRVPAAAASRRPSSTRSSSRTSRRASTSSPSRPATRSPSRPTTAIVGVGPRRRQATAPAPRPCAAPTCRRTCCTRARWPR